MIRLILLVAALMWSAVADAQDCGALAPVAADGRVLGHLPYGDTPESDLVDAPAGFAAGQPCRIRREVLPDLERLLAAAKGQEALIGTLRGLSCTRSVVRQQAVFCRGARGGDAADRAISVAPPGNSEHSTGYAIDFAVRPANGCPDAEACMAATPAWRWLATNAPRYGFEMSFPGGNKQSVKWEPWHWRWVGTSASAPGAARARFLFARARRDYPADPAIYDPVVLTNVPAPPTFIAAPPYQEGKRKKRLH